MCGPVPSPQVNFSPLAVVKVIAPRRMNCRKQKRNNRSIETTERAIPKNPGLVGTFYAQEPEWFQYALQSSPKTIELICYPVVYKADIPKMGGRGVAPQARFHSRDNRLKGDAPAPLSLRAGTQFPGLESIGMVSRAHCLAAVVLLVGCLAAPSAWAQATNLEAGKSASQLFAGTCNACHKSPRGLMKTVSAGSLSGFLR